MVGTLNSISSRDINTEEHSENPFSDMSDALVRIISLNGKGNNTLLYARCLGAICSVFTAQRNFKIDSSNSYAPHLRYLKYLNLKPNFFDVLLKEWDLDKRKINIQSLPLGRLQSFLRYVEIQGPSLLEVVNFIASNIIVPKRAQPSITDKVTNHPIHMLSVEELIRFIQLSLLKNNAPCLLDIKIERLLINYRVVFNSTQEIELEILLGYLHLHRFATEYHELISGKQLI